jgi:ABC-2 type transport system ATP-binding protein
MTVLIETHELTKRFRGVTALKGIDLSIDPPGPVGLVGKNGAGKTTLLSVLCGAMLPSAGTVRVLGQEPGSTRLSGALGVLMQETAYRRGLGVDVQLLHLARLQGMTPGAARAQIGSLLEQLDAAAFVTQPPERLSYGQRKRLGIAQALLGDPRVVLLDEPTAGLDPVAADTVRALMRREADNRLLLVSSHNLYEIGDVCRRILIIDRGTLVADEDISRLKASRNSLVLTLDREAPPAVVEALMQLPEITDVTVTGQGRTGLTVHFATVHVDRLQVEILSTLTAQGVSVTGLTRERALADGVLERLSGEGDRAAS